MFQHPIMRYIFSAICFLISCISFANKSSAEIYVDLQKVHSLKRVLYIAAHPDDENTRALAWFSLSEKAETAYLSLTRGDGGQNLIGEEFSEDLGVLRTQELLAARKIDRAKQFFTRAVDFGYSKSADETLQKWGKAEMLADVVLIIRKFKPDVIITRFPPDERAGHGHHTASTLLALEAFEKAADPSYLPNQVAEYGTWKTTAIYWNAAAWADKEIATKALNNPDYLIQDIGGYNSLLGQSYNEIGTLARSQHKCQGFGAIIERGSTLEYFQHLGGEKLKSSFFEKNTANWTSLVSAQFSADFDQLLASFDFVNPENNVSKLLSLRKILTDIPTVKFSDLKKEKIAQLDQIIVACLGLHIEVVANDYAVPVGEKLTASINLLNRSNKVIQLANLGGSAGVTVLSKDELIKKEITLTNLENLSIPYWLEKPFTDRFDVSNPAQIGLAENQPTFTYAISFLLDEEKIELNVPVTYKWRDPSFGERRREVISTPDFTVNFEQSTLVMKPGQVTTIKIKIHSFKENLNDKLIPVVSEGWQVSPSIIEIQTKEKHEEIWKELTIRLKGSSNKGVLSFKNSAGKPLKSHTEIAYDHIPTQLILKPGQLELVPLDATIIPGKVAYIKGAGDAVPQAIQQLGFDVTEFTVADLATINLNEFKSVVIGIRAYNVSPELHNFDKKLSDYVFQGGNLVMQYQTFSRIPEENKYGPVSFEISRNRVTEEDAKTVFLSDHTLLKKPNVLTDKDFQGWVQERGLYFATNWDASFTPILGWNDQGEEMDKGALIVASHGKGQFVYTGISFFRELPNGVQGAYRLFANILSYQAP